MKPTTQISPLRVSVSAEPNGVGAIWNHGKQPDLTVEVDFVESGLRAAKNSRPIPRSTILNDIALMLRCSPRDLEFLFDGPNEAANDSSPVAMPDYRRYGLTDGIAAAAE